jgi:hypothetical protein
MDELGGHLQTPYTHPHPPNVDVSDACVGSSWIDCSLDMEYSLRLNLHRSFLSLLDAVEIHYQPKDGRNRKSLRLMNSGY